MKEIGRRIYYELATGNVIVNTGERAGFVVDTTQEQDFVSYAELAARTPETVGVVQLAYAEYAQDFRECNGYRINPVTGAIEFSYPDPNVPPTPPVYQKPLTEEMSALKAEKAALEQKVAQLNGDFAAFTDFYFEKNPTQA